jgi:hypothetical protein
MPPSMNSPLIRSSVTLRVTRAIGATAKMPIAIVVFIRLGGVTAKINSTSTIGGNSNITSTTRMTASSVTPRRYPTMRPSGTPTAMLISVVERERQL